jgi:transposase-like protein
LSKDAVSRLVGRLADDFETWRHRDLTEDQIQYLLLDGWYPQVRIGKRRVRVPVLVTLGVRADGERVVLDVRLAGDESTAAWRDVIRSLVERQVGRPLLALIDGSAGLAAALREQWPTLAIQRCTAHKLRNLEAKAPARLREELVEDYRRMIYAETHTLVEQARARFTKKWRCDVRPSSSASMRRATISSRFCAFRRPHGRRSGRPTPLSGSTGSFDAERKRRRGYQDKTPFSCCSSVCCAAVT